MIKITRAKIICPLNSNPETTSVAKIAISICNIVNSVFIVSPIWYVQ